MIKVNKIVSAITGISLGIFAQTGFSIKCPDLTGTYLADNDPEFVSEISQTEENITIGNLEIPLDGEYHLVKIGLFPDFDDDPNVELDFQSFLKVECLVTEFGYERLTVIQDVRDSEGASIGNPTRKNYIVTEWGYDFLWEVPEMPMIKRFIKQ